MTSAAFRELAGSLLDKEDAALLDAVGLDSGAGGEGPAYAEDAPASGSGFIDRWREWERALRLNLARYRAGRLKRDGGASAEPPAHPADAAAAVKAAAALDSPLEAEFLLDKARWDAADHFQGIDWFDRNSIYAYLLKLLLLERRAAFQVEEGFAEYKALYASILDRVQSVGEAK
jgi:hypothetical protein